MSEATPKWRMPVIGMEYGDTLYTDDGFALLEISSAGNIGDDEVRNHMELIVRAVNSHDALLEACKAAVDAINDLNAWPTKIADALDMLEAVDMLHRGGRGMSEELDTRIEEAWTAVAATIIEGSEFSDTEKAVIKSAFMAGYVAGENRVLRQMRDMLQERVIR